MWCRYFVGLVLGLGCVLSCQGQTLLFVTEYSTGNIKAYDFSGPSGVAVSLPAGYTPVGGSTAGADGMVVASDGRMYVNRDGGGIYRRSADGSSFALFTTIAGSPTLLDLTANTTHLFSASFGTNVIYRTDISTGTYTSITGPIGASQFDGVRIGPDGRLYAVDSSDGDIFAYDLSTSTWTTFLTSSLSGAASQMEILGDDVYISRTIGGQARIYRYTLNVSGNYASGLNPLSETLIGSFGTGTATGIRIGPDGRLYANNFNTGEIWRSNVGITAMEASAYITGLSSPGSIYFSVIPEVSWGWFGLLVMFLSVLLAHQLRRLRPGI
jgi:streptogramin lyase